MYQFFQCFCFFFPQLIYIYVRIFYMLILRNLPHHTVCVGGPSPRHRRLASTRRLPGTAEWSCTDNTGRGNCQTFRSSTLSSSDLYRPWLRCVWGWWYVCGYGCECECVGRGCVFICVCVLQCIRVRLFSTFIFYLSGAYAWWCTLQRVCNQLSSQTKSSNAIFGNHLSIYVHTYV